ADIKTNGRIQRDIHNCPHFIYRAADDESYLVPDNEACHSEPHSKSYTHTYPKSFAYPNNESDGGANAGPIPFTFVIADGETNTNSYTTSNEVANTRSN
ncbi:hypothetical protein ACHAWF_000256, partial [Thalassiosira exigua]